RLRDRPVGRGVDVAGHEAGVRGAGPGLGRRRRPPLPPRRRGLRPGARHRRPRGAPRPGVARRRGPAVSPVAGIGLANPAGLWLLALAVPILLLHVLRPRRTRTQVRSVMLWRQVSTPVAAASPWQRLVPS